MYDHSIVSKAFAKFNTIISPLFSISQWLMVSYESQVLSPINLFAMNPVWSGFTTVSKVDLSLFASFAENNLYVLLSIVSGLQFFSKFLSLPCFGIQVIVPRLTF